MAITAAELKSILQQQQSQFEAAQLKLIQTLTQNLSLQSTSPQSSQENQPPAEFFGNSITEFHYDPEADVTFESWFRRYEDLFRIEYSKFSDDWKVRLLLRKLSPSAYEKYSDFILPKKRNDFNFNDTIDQLKEIFGNKSSLFNIRYHCFKLVKEESDDYLTYAGIVNRECEKSKVGSMTENQFKCLIFVAGLHSPDDADVRTRVLSRIDQNPDITLQELTNECQRLVNLKHDTRMVENSRPENAVLVNAVKNPKHPAQVSPDQHSNSRTIRPPTECWFCGSWHFAKYCPYRNHKCTRCRRFGHKEGFCHKLPRRFRNFHALHHPRYAVSYSKSVTSRVAGVPKRKFIHVTINDCLVRLQIDTASDITIISRSIWHTIGRPLIKPTNHTVKNASGDTMHLAGVIHCSVKFGNINCDGVCCISEVPNLNLLGLDWIEKLHLFDVPLNSVCSHVTTSHPISSSSNDRLCSDLVAKIRQDFAPIFADGLGHCTKMKATLQLHQDANPVFRPKRPVPYAVLPILDKELDRLQSTACASAAKLPAKVEPCPWPESTEPWSRIHVDFAGPVDGQSFMIVVDACSKWPEVFTMNNTSSTNTVSTLRRLFSSFGIPKILVSDNGPQFTSHIFSEFCERNGIQHIHTPPYHPQSNGQVERFVDTFKRALLKSRGEGTIAERIDKFLLQYRSTPHPSLAENKTPAEILFGRRLRTTLGLLSPMNENDDDRKTTKGNKYYCAKRKPFKIGDHVYTLDYRTNGNRWIAGVVTKRIGHVLYEVKVDSMFWRRHINQLRPTMTTKVNRESSNQLNLENILSSADTTWHRNDTPQHAQQNAENLVARRYPYRTRRPVETMQVIPSQRYYF